MRSRPDPADDGQQGIKPGRINKGILRKRLGDAPGVTEWGVFGAPALSACKHQANCSGWSPLLLPSTALVTKQCEPTVFTAVLCNPLVWARPHTACMIEE